MVTNNGWNLLRIIIHCLKSRDPIVLLAFVGLLTVFVLGMFSESQTSVWMGKSFKLWLIILVDGSFLLFLSIILVKFRSVQKIISRGILLGLTSILLLETTGFILPQIWPLDILRRTPEWTQQMLPDRAFDRDNFRPLRLEENQHDEELVYRLGPNLNVDVRWSQLRFKVITDSFGFPNSSEGLYDDADVVVVGDSFTQGWGVNGDQSWVSRLADQSRLRILNLGTGGWHVYQYPRALARYAPAATPAVIIVTLTSFEDLSPQYYLTAMNPIGTDPTEVSKKQGKESKNGGLGVQGLGDVSQPDQHLESNKESNALNSPEQFNMTGERDSKPKNRLSSLSDTVKTVLPFTMTTVVHTISRSQATGTCDFNLNGERILYTYQDSDKFIGVHQIDYLEEISADLLDVVDIAVDLRADLYFVYLPYPEEVYIPIIKEGENLSECAESLREDYDQGKFAFDTYYNIYSSALSSRSDFNLLDATPFLRDVALTGQQLNWDFDGHPNIKGHQAIADFVEDILVKR